MARSLVFTFLLSTIAAGCSARPPARSFTDLQQRIRPGHTLYVIDAAGTETRGKLTAFTPSGLTLVDVSGISRAFDEPQIRQVQRYGDSLWNGVLIGLAFGATGALINDSQYEPCPDNPQRQCAQDDAAQRVLFMGTMTGFGAGIDALIRSRQQVFLAPGQTSTMRRFRVAPFLHQRGGGVSLTLVY